MIAPLITSESSILYCAITTVEALRTWVIVPHSRNDGGDADDVVAEEVIQVFGGVYRNCRGNRAMPDGDLRGVARVSTLGPSSLAGPTWNCSCERSD